MLWQRTHRVGPLPEHSEAPLREVGGAAEAGEPLVGANTWAADIIALARERVRRAVRAWHGPEAKIVEVPVPALFERDEEGLATALLPNSVNLQVLGTDLVVPDPLVPALRDEVARGLGQAGFRVHFLKSLTYHVGGGQLRCASKVLRTPAPASWPSP